MQTCGLGVLKVQTNYFVLTWNIITSMTRILHVDWMSIISLRVHECCRSVDWMTFTPRVHNFSN
jgi:hypothetical protein